MKINLLATSLVAAFVAPAAAGDIGQLFRNLGKRTALLSLSTTS